MSQYTFYRILARRMYTDHAGKEKSVWYSIGHLKIPHEGGGYLRLYQHPNEDYFLSSPDTDRDTQQPDIY